jgi:hypothetical protein|tara:strand:+ start:435 stop:959 length:525 start_codon:yes stop_codon:yes gene_type:complete
MSKISNQAAYPALLQPTLDDYLVITDYDNKLRTKTVNLSTVKNLFDVSYSDVTIGISSAELKALLATPKTLIAAPGVGKVLEVFSIFAYMDVGVTAYDFADPVQVKMGVSVWADIPTSTVMNSAVDASAHFSKTFLSCPENTAIVFQAQGQNATVGTGTMKINLRFRTIDLQTF